VNNFEKDAEEIYYHTYDTIYALLTNAKSEVEEYNLLDLGFAVYGDKRFVKQAAAIQALKVYPANRRAVTRNQKIVDKFKPILDNQINKLKNFDISKIDLNQVHQYGIRDMQDAEDMREHFRLMLGTIKSAISAIDERSSLSLFKQSFIITVALFEALFSDKLKQIVSEKFFEFINANEKNVKNKIEGIFGYNSFESFQEVMIANLIDNSQIRSLVKMLYEFNSAYYIINGTDICSGVTEILARRNVHLHRKGIVDQGYFDQAECNINNIEIGDYLPIGHDYYNHAYNTLVAFMRNL